MKLKNKSIKYNFIMNVILTISSLIFPLVTFPYITRVLLPEGTGNIAFSNSIVSYFSMFAMLGIPTYGIRACAKARDNKDEFSGIVQEIFIINAITTIGVCLVFVYIVLNVPVLNQEKELLLICGLYLILNMLSVEWLYKGLECYTYITVISLTFKALGTLAIFLLVHHKSDYLVYALIAVVANTGYGLFNFIHARQYIFRRKVKSYDFKRHLRPIVTFFAMSIAVVIYTNLDVVMLGFMKGPIEVGYYDIAVKIKIILVNVVTALGAVVLPRVSYYIEKKNMKDFYNIITKAFELVAVISLPLMVYFIIMADNSILVLAGNQYLESINAMKIIMPTLVLIGFSNLLGIQILIPLGKENIVVRSEIIGAVINVVLNFGLIPRLGASGAAIGTLAAEGGVLVIQYKYLKSMIKPVWRDIQVKKISLALFIGLAILVCLKILLNLESIIELVITSVAFFTIYAIILIKLNEPITVLAVKTVMEKIRSKENE
jgi:O-antigen/teichoic acid export membrane protein